MYRGVQFQPGGPVSYMFYNHSCHWSFLLVKHTWSRWSTTDKAEFLENQEVSGKPALNRHTKPVPALCVLLDSYWSRSLARWCRRWRRRWGSREPWRCWRTPTGCWCPTPRWAGWPGFWRTRQQRGRAGRRRWRATGEALAIAACSAPPLFQLFTKRVKRRTNTY